MPLLANTKPSLEAKSKLDVAKNWEKSSEKFVANVDALNSQLEKRIDDDKELSIEEALVRKQMFARETQQYAEFHMRLKRKKNEVLDGMMELLGRSGPLGFAIAAGAKAIGGVFRLFAGSREQRQERKVQAKAKAYGQRRVDKKFAKSPAGELRAKATEATKIQSVVNRKMKTNPQPVYDMKLYALLRRSLSAGGGAIGGTAGGGAIGAETADRIAKDVTEFKQENHFELKEIHDVLSKIAARGEGEDQKTKKKKKGDAAFIVLAVLGVVAAIAALTTFLRPALTKVLNFIKPIIDKISGLFTGISSISDLSKLPARIYDAIISALPELASAFEKMILSFAGLFDKYFITPFKNFFQETVGFFFSSDKKSAAAEISMRKQREYDENRAKMVKDFASVNEAGVDFRVAGKKDLGFEDFQAVKKNYDNIAKSVDTYYKENRIKWLKEAGKGENSPEMKAALAERDKTIADAQKEYIKEIAASMGVSENALVHVGGKQGNKDAVTMPLHSLLGTDDIFNKSMR